LGTSDEDREYIAAWKWHTVTRKPPATVLLPPITMPAFDVIRVEGETLTRVCTVPVEVLPAGTAVVNSDDYSSINSPSFPYAREQEEGSDRKAREVMSAFEVGCGHVGWRGGCWLLFLSPLAPAPSFSSL
jgi:hypothetical protein